MLPAIVLLVAAVIAPIDRGATAARATTSPAHASPSVTEGDGSEPGDDVERWWGVVGAVVCGFEARLIIRAPAIGMNPYALAAGISGCALAALDIFTTH